MKMNYFLLAMACLATIGCNKIHDYFPGSHDHYVPLKKVYGGAGQDDVQQVVATSTGGYFLAANTASSDGDVSGNKGGGDGWAVKLDNDGKILWQKPLGGSNYDVIYSAASGYNNSYVVAGLTTSNDGDVVGHHGEYDGWIVKLNGAGNLVWQKPIGGTGSENFEYIIKCEGGGYLAVGLTNSNDGDVSGHHGEDDGWVVKVNESGAIVWKKAIGGSGTDRLYSATNTFDGGYLLVGLTNSTDGNVGSNHGSQDGWVIKLDRNGKLLWEKTFGGTESDYFEGITPDRDGNYLVTGSTDSNDGDVSGNHGETDIWVIKINSKGKLIWQKTYGGSRFEQSRAIYATIDGGFVVAGPSGSNDGDVKGNHGDTDGWVFKIDGKGKLKWQKSAGGTDTDIFNTVISKWDGTVVAGGWTTSNNGDVSGLHGSNDAWVMSFRPF